MSDELTAIRTVLAEPEGPSEQAWTEARAALMAAIEEGVESRPRGRRRWWVPALGLGTAALAAGIVLLVTQAFLRGGAVQASPAAAAVLRRAADAVVASPPATLKRGEYWYAESERMYRGILNRRGEVGWLVSAVSRQWIGHDRALVRVRTVKVVPVPSSRPWQRRALRALWPLGTRSKAFSSRPTELPIGYQQMLAAPVSTPALAKWVLRAEAAPGFTPKPRYWAQNMLTTISAILTEPMVPARLRAGLYQLVATIPGVRTLGTTTDLLGRPVLAIGFRDQITGSEDELLFDPSTYALLDYRETAVSRVDRGLPGGSVMEETSLLAAGLVHRIGQMTPNLLPLASSTGSAR